MSTSQNERDGLWTGTFGELGATLKALEDRGVKLGHLRYLRANSAGFADAVADFIVRGFFAAPKPSGYGKIRELLGHNFFGPWEWSTFFGQQFSYKERGDPKSDDMGLNVPAFPWDVDLLNSPCPFTPDKMVKDTHFAFLGLTHLQGQPLTLRKWLELCNTYRGYNNEISDVVRGRYGHLAETGPTVRLDNYYGVGESHDFLKTTCGFRWHLMPLAGLEVSDKGFDYKETETWLENQGYEMASAIEEVTKLVLGFHTRGAYPPFSSNDSHGWESSFRAAPTQATVCRDTLVTEDGSMLKRVALISSPLIAQIQGHSSSKYNGREVIRGYGLAVSRMI